MSSLSDIKIVSRSDSVSIAAQAAIQRAKNRGDEEVTPDDLLAGTLQAVSRFGIVWVGGTSIDLDALGLGAPAIPTESKTKVAYSAETAAIFDRAAGLARRDSADRVDAVHLLAAYAPVTTGLMGELKRRYGLDDSTWRAGLSLWPRGRRSGLTTAVDAGESRPVVKEFLSPEEAAEFLGLHIQTVRGYIRSGKLAALRIAGERAIRIRRDDLVGLLEPFAPGGAEESA